MIENDISSEMRGMLLVTCGNSLLPFLWLLILEEDVWIDTKSLVIFDTLLFFLIRMLIFQHTHQFIKPQIGGSQTTEPSCRTCPREITCL